MEQKKLYKGRDKMLSGVCSGIAEYFGWDVTLVRIATVLLTVTWGTGLLLYIAAALIMPENPYQY